MMTPNQRRKRKIRLAHRRDHENEKTDAKRKARNQPKIDRNGGRHGARRAYEQHRQDQLRGERGYQQNPNPTASFSHRDRLDDDVLRLPADPHSYKPGSASQAPQPVNRSGHSAKPAKAAGARGKK